MKEIELANHEIGQQIYDDLVYNLNQWPRVEAKVLKGVHVPPEWYDADRHFYETVLPPKRLAALSEITRDIYPVWGQTIGEGEDQRIVGGQKAGGTSFVPVGLRWAESLDQWDARGKNAAAKTLRNQDNIDKGYWKPQIVVTIRPLSVYRYFRENPQLLAKSAHNSWKFVPSRVEKDPLWQKKLETPDGPKTPFRIIPLKFNLRIIGRLPSNGKHMVKDLFASDESRHFNDDDEFDITPELLDQDLAMRDKLNKILHAAYVEWKG